MPSRFSFLLPEFFLAPPMVFFWEEEVGSFWAEKTLKFAISARKSLRISAKTFFFWRSPAFGRKICDFGQKKPSHFGEDLFFGDHLLLVGKFVISAGKSLRISAKTFAPLILILPPRSREAGDPPVTPYIRGNVRVVFIRIIYFVLNDIFSSTILI